MDKLFKSTILQLYGDEGKKWLEELPSLLADLEKRWQFKILNPFSHLTYNYVLKVSLFGSSAAVLKCGVPYAKINTEIAALKHFNGEGSIKLLEADAELGVMLLEEALPGRTLFEIKDDEKETEIFANVISRLHKPLQHNADFPTVQQWFEGLTRFSQAGGASPFPLKLIDEACKIGKELIDSMGKPVLLHGDLHHMNILSATRESWLAIDPKGVVGEREYEVGAFMRNPIPALTTKMDTKKILTRRIEILTDMTGFDKKRIIGWSFSQAVLAAIWCFEDMGAGFEPFIQCAEVLREIDKALDTVNK